MKLQGLACTQFLARERPQNLHSSIPGLDGLRGNLNSPTLPLLTLLLQQGHGPDGGQGQAGTPAGLLSLYSPTSTCLFAR